MTKKPTSKKSPAPKSKPVQKPVVEIPETESGIVGTLRVPYAITIMAKGRRDPLSRKINANAGQGEREHWGPLVQFTKDETEKLTSLMLDIRKNPESTAKQVSAANKLLAAVRELEKPPEKGAAPQTPLGGIAGLKPVNMIANISPENHTVTIATEKMPKFRSSPELDAAMDEIVAATQQQVVEPMAGIDHRRQALMRAQTLHEILRIEKPGCASVVAQIIEDIKRI